MPYHEVSNLKWARKTTRPESLKVGRPRGAKALGIGYEKALAKALPKALAGIWWEYQDDSGVRVCQTDFVIIGKDQALVLEAKYTYTRNAWGQIRNLYIPVLSMALGRPVVGVQVCKVLRPEWNGITTDNLARALSFARAGDLVVLHWSGLGPLPTKLEQN